MITEAKPAELPRGEDVRRGLYPGSGYLRYVLGEPVVTDEQAEELVALVGYLEDRQAKVEAWYRAAMARIEQAKQAMAGSPAFKSLAGYVKAHPTKIGGKSLVTAYGEVKLRTQKGILRVYDEKLARELCPEAVEEYIAPPRPTLKKDKLKAKLEKDGPLTFQGAEGLITVAEIVPSIETMSIEAKPSSEMEGDAIPPKLLGEIEKENMAHENATEPAK